MEHRWNKRAKAHVEVALYRHGRLLAHCHSRDVSLEGMYLALDADTLDLQVGGALDVIFTPRTGKPSGELRSGAVVRHRRPEGVGIMFATFQPEVLAFLDAAANGRRAPRPTAPAAAASGVGFGA